jgi:hypothetical protein
MSVATTCRCNKKFYTTLCKKYPDIIGNIIDYCMSADLALKTIHQECAVQVRKYVYHDADNLDTAFDAGGKVSIGLTATTIVSQWTWSATLLQSSTVASKVSCPCQ